MKKMLLFLTLAAVGLNLSAQNSTRNWEKTAIVPGTNPVPATGYSWFVTATPAVVGPPAIAATTANVNSCAYNPYNDKLYVANRGIDIYIINPATGAQEGILNKTGVNMSLSFSKIRVTSTGEIFATSLKTSTTLGNTLIYYWAPPAVSTDPYGAPVLLGTAVTGIQTIVADRAGDAFGVTGSGTGVTLYMSGTSSTSVQVITTSGPLSTNFSKTGNITVLASAGRSAIAPIATGTSASVWISGVGLDKRLITSAGVETKVLVGTNLIAPGTYTVTPAGSISNKFSSSEYFEVGSKKFLALTGANDNVTTPTGEGLALHIYDVTDFNAITLIENTKLTNTYNVNGNATSDIGMKRVINVDGTTTITFFQLVNQNGLASYSLVFNADGTLPVELTSFNAGIKNNKNTLTWTTASESNNAGFEVESSTTGSNFNKVGFVATKAANGNSNAVLTYAFEDAKAAKGTTYYRLKQVDFNGDFKYSDVKFIDNKLTKNVEFSVYPNPVTDYVDIVGADAAGVSIQLFTASGKEINVKLVDGRLNMSAFEAGIYILKVSKNGQFLQTNKLIKK